MRQRSRKVLLAVVALVFVTLLYVSLGGAGDGDYNRAPQAASIGMDSHEPQQHQKRQSIVRQSEAVPEGVPDEVVEARPSEAASNADAASGGGSSDAAAAASGASNDAGAAAAIAGFPPPLRSRRRSTAADDDAASAVRRRTPTTIDLESGGPKGDDVPFIVHQPVFAGSLTDSDIRGTHDRFLTGGYDKRVLKLEEGGRRITIKGADVHNELFLSACDVAAPAEGEPLDCEALQGVREEVRGLDDALHKHFRGLSGSAKSKIEKSMRKRPGLGATARGWGIAGPFTNKWRFYQEHLLDALNSPHRVSEGRAYKDAPGQRGVHFCEVGFLAGHSTAVLTGILGIKNVSSATIFDYPQPDTYYALVGSNYFHSRYARASGGAWSAARGPDDSGVFPRFDFFAGGSRTQVPAAVRSGRLRQCDFVSLDGSKMVVDVIADFEAFAQVAHSGTSVVCDDVWTTKVTTLVRKGRSLRAIPVETHEDVLAAFVLLGALEISGVWHSDQNNWPAYGNMAFKYRRFGADFTRIADRLLRAQKEAVVPLDLTNELPDRRSCSAAAPLLGKKLASSSCCTGKRSSVPVTSLVGKSFVPTVREWSAASDLISKCRAALGGGGADHDESNDEGSGKQECAAPPAAARALANPFDYSPYLTGVIGGRAVSQSKNVVCLLGARSALDTVDVAALLDAFARRGSGDRARVRVVPLTVEARGDGEPRVSPDSAAAKPTWSGAEQDCGVKIDQRFSPGRGACDFTVVDTRGVAEDAMRSSDPGERLTLLASALKSMSLPGCMVLAHVNAAAIVTYVSGFIHRRPPAPREWGIAPRARETWERLKATSAVPTGQLTDFETDVALAIVIGVLHVHGAEMPVDPADAAHGTLAVCTHAAPLLQGKLLFAVSDITISASWNSVPLAWEK